jgi:hypothetical protein
MNEATNLAELAGASVKPSEDVDPLLRPFFNVGDPACVLQREKPLHRAIVVLKAQCLSNVQIAERLGITPPTVAYVCKQKWALDMLRESIGQAGQDELEILLNGATADSVRKLIELRDDQDAPKEVQRKSANDILDRVFGRPTQPISHSQVDPNELSDAELAEIARKGKTN